MVVRITLVSLLLAAAGASAATLSGSPDPAPVCDGSGLTQLTIAWNAADTNPARVEVHVGSATGTLFAAGQSIGSAVTGKWVANGTQFMLVNAVNKEVLAQFTAHLNTAGCAGAAAPPAERKSFWRRLFGK